MPPSPEPGAAGLRIEQIQSLPALERLRPEWETLWWEAPTATPFQSPDWLIPWWRHLGEGELFVLALRGGAEGRLLGLVPLYLHGQVLRPLGIATSDYLDALAAPGLEAAVMAQALAELARPDTPWKACDWPRLRPGAVLLAGTAPPGWLDERLEDETCPVLPLPPDPACLAGTLPRHMRQNLRTALRRAEQVGRLSFEMAEAHNLDEVLASHLRLHGARWAERGEAGVLAPASVQAALRDSLPGLLRQGLLRLHALRLDGAITATLHALADRPGMAGRRVYFYLGGFDPRFAALSPGTLLLAHAIEEAAREGAAGFDFLRGGEAYKYRWGARDTPVLRRRLHRAATPR